MDTQKKDTFIQSKKVQDLEKKNKELNEKVEELQHVLKQQDNDSPLNSIKLSEIKLRSNIRNDYDFEEIENLALDLLENGQEQPVFVTKDNYLISGHRRYFALLKNNPDGEIFIHYSELYNSEISDSKLQDLQYSENTQRRDIDNFQMSDLYNSKINNDNLKQADLVIKYKRDKGTVSAITALKNIDPKIKYLIKEIQLLGVTMDLLGSPNFVRNKKYQPGIIGYQPLYKIANKKDIESQGVEFIRIFGDRLTPEQREQFPSLPKKTTPKSFDKVKKSLTSLAKILDSDVSPAVKEKEEYQEILNDIEKLEVKLKGLKFN